MICRKPAPNSSLLTCWCVCLSLHTLNCVAVGYTNPQIGSCSIRTHCEPTCPTPGSMNIPVGSCLPGIVKGPGVVS
ncbi:hypothetical protein BJX68DRAFT_94181 [Aspergillus pseudodeflectus]|uniref:Secreted protein n=1 Tax=Aspergillus pseudodeflectus TaxID=176178 RepID=A0ABR4KCW7_9EURO